MSGFVRASSGSATIGGSTVTGTLTPASTEVDLGSTSDRFGTVGVERLAAELVHASQVSVTSVSATQITGTSVSGTVVTQGGYALASHVIQSGSETTAGSGLVSISISSHPFSNYRITGSLASSSSVVEAGLDVHLTTGAGVRAAPNRGATISYGSVNLTTVAGSTVEPSMLAVIESAFSDGGVFSIDLVKPNTQFAGGMFQSAAGGAYARSGGGVVSGDVTGLQLLLYSTASTQDSCNLTYTLYGIT